MWEWSDNTTFDVLPVLYGNPEFNYFFTLVCIFGIISVAVGLLVKVITRS